MPERNENWNVNAMFEDGEVLAGMLQKHQTKGKKHIGQPFHSQVQNVHSP